MDKPGSRLANRSTDLELKILDLLRVSAAIVLGMSVLVLLLLRQAGPSSDAEGPADTAPDRSSPGPPRK